ncbi:reverse transcriptase [Phytophthora megakarya]|uniref:Reverse transcriptase n=1 Tax=Phytophthora megakarya TaxID=4795 RepID=A0A225WRJ4_9STRA|nr:reverse transcriptase [Phytophthora megakarya]
MERSSADIHEADLDQDPDLEEKPRIPLKAAKTATADLNENLDLYTTNKETTKSKSNPSTKSVAATRSSKKKKIKTARTKLKAPDLGSGDVNKPRSTIAKAMIEQAYYRKILSEPPLQDPVLGIIQVRQIGDLTGPISKPNISTDMLNAVKILLDLLQETGLVPGEFDLDSLFEMELGAIQAAAQDLYESLKILRQKCVEIGDNVFTTEGRTRIKITLAGYLVFIFDIWIGDLSGQNAILGMDFMVPAGVRMDLADGSMRLPDEVGTPLNGRKRLYGKKVRSVILERNLRIPVGRSEETAARIKLSATEKLWVTRGERWVPTVMEGPGQIRYLVISNIGEEILWLDHRLDVGMILDQDKVPRSPGFVSVGSRRYRECQNLALESTVDARSEPPQLIEDPAEPAVQRPTNSIEGGNGAPQIEATLPTPEMCHLSTPTTSPDPDRYLSGDAGGGGISESMPGQVTDRSGTKDNALYGFLKISRSGDAGATTDVFQTGIADDSDRGSVLGRRSYIDDIMIAAESWDQMCQRVEDLLDACDKWNLSISVAKSFWGVDKFLGSLNYYSRFIKDYAIYASVLSELREVEFAELEKRSDLREIMAFITLKTKIATTPILRLFDETRTLVVIVFASDWAISASLTQEHDGIYHPVAFASRTLKPNELNYNVTEMEVLALLRILDINYNLLVGREIRVLTRHSTLAWLFKSTGLQGRLGQWSALLAPWTLEITKCTKGEDEILGAIAASITPRAKMDDALTDIAPGRNLNAGSKRRYPPAIVWSLPGWKVVKARSGYLESLTVNEAEYNGLIPGLDMLENLDRKRLVICDEFNLLIRQRYWNGSADSLRMPFCNDKAGSKSTEGPNTNAHHPSLSSKIARGVTQENLIREMRVDRIKRAQEEEVWIAGMKKYLNGAIADLTQAEARSYGKIAGDYEVDEQDLLFYCPPTPRSGEDRDRKTGDQGQIIGEIAGDVPFQIIAMDHIPSLPRSHKGNSELLIWVDLFTEYVIAKANSSRSAQTVAESYEECVFRRFGASEMIRHDREPVFISDFFREFNKILGKWQQATMAYRPQANGTAERMVQIATRALKMYVRELDQKDWVEYAERLTFAIITAHDRIRGDTPHYLGSEIDVRGYTASRILREAIADRASRHNEDAGSHQIEAVSRVWLYLDRGKVGYAWKLAHLWHGPFRVAEKINELSIKLDIAGTGYQIFPVVHVSKLKLVKDFSDRPRLELMVDKSDHLDFDEILLPEDSRVPDLGAD